MKMNKILTVFAMVTMAFVVTSCVEDDDYAVPNSLGQEENAGLQALMQAINAGTVTEISIQELKDLFDSAGETEQIVSEIAVKGYVTSSDRTGNFYKEFYIQDAPENPTAAMGISLNQVDSYNQFNFGREVYIYLKDLYLGENSSDVVSIGGGIEDNNLSEMSVNQISTHVFRSTTTMEIVPVLAAPSDVNQTHLGMYVTLENVQFPSEFDGNTFHNPNNDFDTSYPLVSCDDGSQLDLETSSFANFSQVPLPTDGRGSISGVVTQTFGGDNIVMLLNSTEEIVFDQERCDPLFEDSFGAGNLDNWTTYSVTGPQEWYYNTFGNPSDSATMSGFSGGPIENEDWLISLPIDLSGVANAYFSFQNVKRYTGNDIEVYFCTDYNGGDPTTDGTWQALSPDLDTNTGSWSSWTNSGNLDVSAAAGGNLFVAFKYTSTNSSSSTWEIDNVKVFVP